MLHTSSLLGVVALCGLLVGGAMWLRAALASAFARGEAYGRALAAVEAGDALARQGAALEAVRRDADRQAATLESEKDALREKLDEIERLLPSSTGGGPGGAPACLDPGVVRALDAIGASGRGAGAP